MPDGPSIAADELVSQAVGGTTTSFAYDAWGRMTSKSDGTYSATYAYRYGEKLASVMSDFPSEGNAIYQYDGAGKRRQRTGGGTTTRYRWDAGWNVLNEEDNLGNLTRTYVGRSTAHVDGSDPSTGTWRFYVHDHLGSTRGVYNSDKTPYAGLEHTPYGELYASSGSSSDITRRYTGHDWDAAAGLYYAPYRYYSPGLARWITRDPLGMVDGPNVYGYAGLNPVGSLDRQGLCSNSLCKKHADYMYRDCKEAAAQTRDLALDAAYVAYDNLLDAIDNDLARCKDACDSKFECEPFALRSCKFLCETAAGTANELVYASLVANLAAIQATYAGLLAHCKATQGFQYDYCNKVCLDP